MINPNYNKQFTPTYDNDLIPKWYFENRIINDVFIIGEVKTYMGSKVPRGWLLCDGSEISRNQYPKLFSIIGTEYGDGDEISTFELPNLVDNDSILGYKIIKY